MRNLRSFLTKRSFRSTVTLLLMACMMLGLLPAAQAGAPSSFQAEVISASGHGGETVSVAVYMKPGDNFMVDDSFLKYTLKVNYDPAVLTLTGDIVNDAEAVTFDTSESVTGSVYVKADTFPNLFIDERTQVFTMMFAINPDAPPGGTNITLAGGSYSIDDQVEITNLISGKVTVLNDAPTASNAGIGGTLSVGETLTGNYTYADTENNTEGLSVYQWYQASDSAGSDKAAVPAATSKSFQLGNDQLGKYVLFEVTPVASGGVTTGSSVFSAVYGPVTAIGSAASVSIGSREGQPGTTVQVPVTLSTAASSVGSFGVRVAFDTEALEVVSIAGPQAALFDSVYSNTDGYLKTAWADSSGGDHLITAGQDLFTVTFKIKASASYGVKALTIADEADIQQFTLTDLSAVEMTKTLRAGSIKVSQEEQSQGPAAPGPLKEIIQVDVKAPGSKATAPVSKAEIERTTKTDGSKSDKVLLTTEQAKQTVAAILEAKLNTANIIIPDAKDEVSEVNVTVPKDASKLFADAGIDIGIVTDSVKVNIPNDSLQGFNDDLYFHFVPIKNETEKQEINARADKETIVLTVVGDNGVTIVGRPMTIETNLQNRKVELVMPLKGIQLSKEELANLAIYVEHSDGTKELLYGQLVEYGNSEGDLGLQFSVNKFSTFSLVHLDMKPETHSAYVMGYEDGTFRPDNAVTRAELATIISRVIAKDAQAEDIAYNDVSGDYWAADSISKVTTMELMSGYPDGTFAPDQAITRAEMASLAANLIADDIIGEGFTDITGHWANAAILKAQGAGVMQGYTDGSFKPEQLITRAEAVVMLNRTLGRKPSGDIDISKWNDVAKTNWAFADIMEASIEHSYTKDAAGIENWVEQP